MKPGTWYIVWTAMLLLPLVGWVSAFAYFEGLALRSGGLTLSMYIWKVSEAWPLFPFVLGLMMGLVVGGLSVHFWWHWLPPGALSEG